MKKYVETNEKRGRRVEKETINEFIKRRKNVKMGECLSDQMRSARNEKIGKMHFFRIFCFVFCLTFLIETFRCFFFGNGKHVFRHQFFRYPDSCFRDASTSSSSLWCLVFVRVPVFLFVLILVDIKLHNKFLPAFSRNLQTFFATKWKTLEHVDEAKSKNMLFLFGIKHFCDIMQFNNCQATNKKSKKKKLNDKCQFQSICRNFWNPLENLCYFFFG